MIRPFVICVVGFSTLLLTFESVEGQLFRRNRARSSCPQMYQPNYAQPNAQQYAGYYAQQQSANCQQRYVYRPDSQDPRFVTNSNLGNGYRANSVLGQRQSMARNQNLAQNRNMKPGQQPTYIQQGNPGSIAVPYSGNAAQNQAVSSRNILQQTVLPGTVLPSPSESETPLMVTGTVVDGNVRPVTFNEPAPGDDLILEAPNGSADGDLIISPPENALKAEEIGRAHV